MKRLILVLLIIPLGAAYAADQFTFPFTVKATTPPPTTTVATGMSCTPAAPSFSSTIAIGTLVTSCTVQPSNWNGNLKPLSNTMLGVTWTGYNTFALKAVVSIPPGSYTETVSATP
jgi:hypothetical protein